VPARSSTRTLSAGGSAGLSGLVRRTVLPGGLRVLTEAVPGLRSASFGVWIDVGSRDEVASLAGASHYLEHLLFKGTRRRSALQIAAELDAVGGEANAFTAKEYTCFYARVLDVDLPLAVDVTCDMITSSLVRAADVDSERSVVLEEIAMHDDDPADVVHDEFAAQVFGPAHPLGRPILGTVDSLEAMTRSAVHGYYRRRYTSPALVVAAAGAVDHATVVRLVREAFGAAGFLDDDAEPAPLRAMAARPAPPRPGARVRVLERETEQVNLVLGGVGIARRDPRRFAWSLLTNALGGGMSSRLFQEVREKRGLAYSVYSFSSSYADTGLWGIYAGCAPARVAEVVDLIRASLVDAAAHGITGEELRRGKGQLRGGLVLGLEDTGDRMNRLGKSELAYGEVLSVEDVLRRVDAVTLDDVRSVARAVLDGPLTITAAGEVDEALLTSAAQ